MNKEEAINRLKLNRDVFEENKQALDIAIEALQDNWIPVSERLPERDEIVLVSYKTTDKVHMCKYLDDGSENPWWSYNDDCLAWNNVILAWMPLPEPYKEQENEPIKGQIEMEIDNG